MKQTSLVIRSLFRQLFKYPVKQYFSQPHTIQSSVGIIFKFPAIQALQTREDFDTKILLSDGFLDCTQMLFVQRAGYAADRNAYNVVFPGGQCDANESDQQACERQLKEEIGIQVKDQCIHLGQLPTNFYYLKKRGKQVHISCHVYCMKSSSNEWQPKLNSEELRKFKWVPLDNLLKAENYHRRNEIKLGVFQRMPAFAAKIAKENITKVTMQELDLGMDRNLWGLTLYLWSYMLQMALHNAGSALKKQEISLISQFINSMLTFDLEFRFYSLYKIPATVIASGWHYLYRVRPFRYNSGQLNGTMKLYKNVFIFVLLVLLVNIFYSLC